MTYDEWEDQFRPIPHGNDRLVLHDRMNRRLRAAHRERRLWTLVEGAVSDACYIIEGWHFVNRIGYVMTRVPYEPGFMVDVRLPSATE